MKFIISHRGYNNNSGRIYRKCGMSQYDKAPTIPATIDAVNEPMFENPENIKLMDTTTGKPPVHEKDETPIYVTLPPNTKFEGDEENNAQLFSPPQIL